jgi:thymidylate synthase (FAD)
MKVIDAGFEVLGNVDGAEVLESIEDAGRTCYKSDRRGDTLHFVDRIIRMGHESVLEHQSISVRIVCDRGVSHELVRHRIASFSQESTRFCNYGKEGEVTFIRPLFWANDTARYRMWEVAISECENAYLNLLADGATPQEARSVLPNSLKTEIVVTMNLREWRHFFKLRAAGTAGKPHPQMLEITLPMLEEFKKLVPVVFDDIQGKQ